MSDYPKLFIFDLNHRVYAKRDVKGYSSGGPIYAEHFIAIELTGETDKDWTGPIYHVNKRSRMARWHGRGERYETFTETEREAMIWMNETATNFGKR
jgi:hypothetical protein